MENVYSIKSGVHRPSEFELSERESKVLCESSIERIINAAINLADDTEGEEADALGDNLRATKSVFVKIVVAAQQAAIAAAQGIV